MGEIGQFHLFRNKKKLEQSRTNLEQLATFQFAENLLHTCYSLLSAIFSKFNLTFNFLNYAFLKQNGREEKRKHKLFFNFVFKLLQCSEMDFPKGHELGKLSFI